MFFLKLQSKGFENDTNHLILYSSTLIVGLGRILKFSGRVLPGNLIFCIKQQNPFRHITKEQFLELLVL